MLLTLLPLLILLLPPSPLVKRRRSDDPEIPPLPYLSNERAHDDDNGSKRVRHNVLPDVRETSIDSLVDSIILQCESKRQDANLDNLRGTIKKLNLKKALMDNKSLIAILDQRKNRVDRNLGKIAEMYPELSLEELKVYCVPLNWSSMKRVNFLCHLSDNLSERAANKLEEKRQLIFDEKWIGKIDKDWINSIAEKYRPHETKYGSVVRLLRFVRNRWHHPDKFQKSMELRSTQRFYNYFHERFPHLLVEAYIAVPHHSFG